MTIELTYFQAPPTRAFFERLSNCAGSKENKSFLRPGVHGILNVCWWKKCPRMPLSHGMLHAMQKFTYIHTYLAQTPEIGQGLGRFLSCGARKQEQT